MSDYALHYWAIPLRGQFIRAILAYAGQRWDEVDRSRIAELKDAKPDEQRLPFMAPPLLLDRRSGLTLAQIPAIVYYLGETLALLPDGVAMRALTLKIVSDANDVLEEITLNGGRQMWTAAKWTAFVPRLERWLAIWEVTGKRHGLMPDCGHLLGGMNAGVADIVTATLWGTLADCVPSIGALIEENAPLCMAPTRRMTELPALADPRAWTRERFGERYCGGEIEKSLRQVLG